MYSFDNDAKDNVHVDNTLQMRRANTPPPISDSSQPPSPSCSTLLVIDDTSNSEDGTINNNTNNIPIKLMPSTIAQISHIQLPTTLALSPLDIINGTIEEQRRRNSSIAKLLGGHRLNNQQYEEINQQILDAQSAQNVINNDNGTDSGVQRSRSSITRTLLMNTERTNSMTKLPPKPPTAPVPAPSFSKDFEYLIRRELDKSDNEHGPSALQRNNSIPKLVQNLNSSSNRNAQPPAQSKLKRKRPISKPPSATANIPPFSLHDPFELDSSATNPIPSANHSQNKVHHFDPSTHPRYSNQQQYHSSMKNSSTNPSSYPCHNMNSSAYNQFSIHQDQAPSNTCSSSCNCPHYSHSTKLTLPSPVTHLPLSATNNVTMTSTRKAKSMLVRSGVHERPRQRSYSNMANQSDSSLKASSKTTIPLKKRLLDAYNNEHHPTSSL